MNVNDLTIGQAKHISEMFPLNTVGEKTVDIYSDFIGKYVICRSRNEGINCGLVVRLDDTGVVLSGARRLYYHKPINKNVAWYEGVASTGISNDSKVGCPSEKLIAEDYSLTLCTNVAKESLIQAKDHVQA